MTAGLTVREAAERDAGAIAAVHLQSFSETYAWTPAHRALPKNAPERRTAFWAGILAEGRRTIFVAEGEPGVVGFYVLRAWHKRGIGRALLAALARRLSAQGLRSVALHVAEQNDSARRFYERLGGRFIQAEPFFDGVDEGTQLAYGWTEIERLTSIDASRPARDQYTVQPCGGEPQPDCT